MLNKLTPEFLTALDRWLLKNKPLIWRTRIHWVLFFSLLTHLVVFILYHLYPLTIGNILSNDARGFFQYIPFTLGCFGLLAWGFSSLKIPVRSNRFSSFLLTAMLYWIGVAAICSNIWVTSKAVDLRMANLLDEQTLTEHKRKIEVERKRSFINTKLSLKEIRQFEMIYRVSPNTMLVGSEPEIEHEAAFNQIYGMPYHKFIMAIKNKIQVIERAKVNKGWLTISFDYYDFFWLFILGLTLLPMVALLLSMIELKTALSLGFGHFLALIGVVLSTFDRSSLFEERYMMLTLILCGLALVLRFNHKAIHWLRLFTISLIPISILIAIEDGLLRQILFNRSGSSSYDLLLSLFAVLLVSFFSYLYYKKINQPQSA